MLQVDFFGCGIGEGQQCCRWIFWGGMRHQCNTEQNPQMPQIDFCWDVASKEQADCFLSGCSIGGGKHWRRQYHQCRWKSPAKPPMLQVNSLFLDVALNNGTGLLFFWRDMALKEDETSLMPLQTHRTKPPMPQIVFFLDMVLKKVRNTAGWFWRGDAALEEVALQMPLVM